MLKKLIFIVLCLLLLFFVLFEPLDNRIFYNREPYRNTLAKLENRQLNLTASSVVFGWGKANITPLEPTNLAGFGPRNDFQYINDSVYVRAIVFTHGSETTALISYDLIMVHPSLASAILNSTKDLVDHIYFSATHTHSSFGQWAKGPFSEFNFGSYSEEIVNLLIKQTRSSLNQAIENQSAGSIGYQEIDHSEGVHNRVDRKAHVDSLIRLISLEKDNGEKALITTFSGHATLTGICNYLSGDYPARVCSKIEKKDAYDFALFMAGGVASCSAQSVQGQKNYKRVSTFADRLVEVIEPKLNNFNYAPLQLVNYDSVPVPMPDPQLKLSNHIVLRPYLFNSIVGDQQAFIKSLVLNEIVFFGYPADFSGELGLELRDSLRMKKFVYTSFNGAYIGYITHPKYYYSRYHEETTLLNWYGPENSSYYKLLSLAYLNDYKKIFERDSVTFK